VIRETELVRSREERILPIWERLKQKAIKRTDQDSEWWQSEEKSQIECMRKAIPEEVSEFMDQVYPVDGGKGMCNCTPMRAPQELLCKGPKVCRKQRGKKRCIHSKMMIRRRHVSGRTSKETGA
jgi:hypothetical protein